MNQSKSKRRGRTGAIVVGAGGGKRLGGVEKAFMQIGGCPLIAYSVEVFCAHPEVDEVCMVVSGESIARSWAMSRERGWRKVTAVVSGGTERQDSVRAGLDALTHCDWVLVHDAARPLVSHELITRGLTAGAATGAAVAATPVRDTLKRVSAAETAEPWPAVHETVDRSELWAAQTPQVFRVSLLRKAFARVGANASALTDDASVVQAAGFPVHLYTGDVQNMKVTLPEDIAVIEALLAWRAINS